MEQVPAVFNEPLLMFTNPADFGGIVMTGGKEVNAVFDRESMTDSGFDIAVADANPRIIVIEGDLPEDVKSVVVTVRGKRCTMAETDFDGCGVIVVQLRTVHDKPTCWNPKCNGRYAETEVSAYIFQSRIRADTIATTMCYGLR